MGNEGNEAPARPRIRGYEIVRAAGSGGMGRVWLGVQKALSRQVAIKIVDIAAEESDPRVARFLRDARLMAQLDHPNIVGVIEAGRAEDGRWFYAMPYLPNGDLRGLVGRATPGDVRKIGTQLLSALEHAHAAGLTHRDLKPKTILLDRAGRPMLSDFGLGFALRDVSPALGDTVSGNRYRSPEHLAGQDSNGMGEAYSLAAMLFELLTGRLPYSADVDFGDAGPQVSRASAHWQPWFAQALARDPRARFASLAAMREALQALPPDGIIPPVWVSPAPAAVSTPASAPAHGAKDPAPARVHDEHATIAEAILPIAAVEAAPSSAVSAGNGAAPRSATPAPPSAVTPVPCSATPIPPSAVTPVPRSATPTPVIASVASVVSDEAVTGETPAIDDAVASEPAANNPFDMTPVGARPRPGTRQRPIWWVPAVAVVAALAIGAPFLVRQMSDRRHANDAIAGEATITARAVPMPDAAPLASAAPEPANPAPTASAATPAAARPPTASAPTQPRPLADVVRPSPSAARDEARLTYAPMPPRDDERERSWRDEDADTGDDSRSFRYRHPDFDPPIAPLVLHGSRRDQVAAIREHLQAGRQWIESQRDRNESRLDYLKDGDREDARLEFEHEREAYEFWREDLEDLRAAVEQGRGPLD